MIEASEPSRCDRDRKNSCRQEGFLLVVHQRAPRGRNQTRVSAGMTRLSIATHSSRMHAVTRAEGS